MLDKNTIILYGASGHGLVIAESILINKELSIAFTDDNKNGIFYTYSVYNPSEIDFSRHDCIVTIGDNQTRKLIVEQVKGKYISAFHPSSILSPSSHIGLGSVFMAGTIVNAETNIGDHCIINTAASIDHECQIGSYAHISPGARLAGNVKIEEGAHIGIGASIIQGVTIGKWAKVGAGAVVIEDVADYDTVVGVPARSIKHKK